MTKAKQSPVNTVDAIDAEAAISDLLGILINRGMSTTDLAVEIGWTRNRVDTFFHGVDIPSREDFEVVAKYFEYELDME